MTITVPSVEVVPVMRHVMKVARVTIAMLTRLLRMRMVANRRLGFWSSPIRARSPFRLDPFLSSRSDCLSEKKATSEPETNAEHNSRTMRMIPPIARFPEMRVNMVVRV